MSSIEVLPDDRASERTAVEGQRVIAIATGANGGVGVGLCERLLELYSLPAGHVIREAFPQPTALLPATRTEGRRETVLTGPALTLILAVRNVEAGEETRKQLLKGLREVIVRRSKEEGIGGNQSARWMKALKIEVERVDFETPYGAHGILAFTERIRKRYPYITSIYANAGLMAVRYVHWGKMILELCSVGPFRCFAYPDRYQVEQKGRMSRDGERGAVWSINTLAPYILIKELSPLLNASPASLGIPPRFVYTSSSTAVLARFDGVDTADAQMVGYDKTYSTSKFAANAIIAELDAQMPDIPSSDAQADFAVADDQAGQKRARRTRCLIAEPAIVQTSVGSANFANLWMLGPIIEAFQWLVFVLCRLCGSPYHVRDGRDAATALLYASLVPDRYLPPAAAPSSTSTLAPSEDSVKWRFGLRAHPLSDATVELKELDRWSEPRAQEIGRVQMLACEDAWRVARYREGLDEKAPV